MDASEAKYIRMTTHPVEKLIAGFAVPSIVCMLMTSIYNMADTWFVSRLNTQSIAAVGIVFSYMGVIQAFSFFFGHGSGNFISRALGARKTDDAATMAATGLISAMAFSILLALLCVPLMTPVLRLLGSTDTILPYARRYFSFILLGSPFISGCLVLNNQMRLQGNAMLSMIGILSGGVLNIILDPLLIFVCGMGVSGAGLATALSQMVCFFVMLHLCGRNGGIGIRPSRFRLDLAHAKEIAAGGLPSLARQGLLFLSTIVLNNFASRYGDAAVAGFSVATRVMSIANAILIGFGQGFQPVCGFNYGAGLYGRLVKALNFCAVVMTGYCVVVGALGIIFATPIIGLFDGADPEVMRIGALVLKYHCFSFPLCGVIILTNMFLQNIRRTWPAVLVAAARQGLFFIPAVLIGALAWGMNGLVAAQPVSDLCAFCLSIPLLASAVRSLRK